MSIIIKVSFAAELSRPPLYPRKLHDAPRRDFRPALKSPPPETFDGSKSSIVSGDGAGKRRVRGTHSPRQG
jgi:hypothetical protein